MKKQPNAQGFSAQFSFHGQAMVVSVDTSGAGHPDWTIIISGIEVLRGGAGERTGYRRVKMNAGYFGRTAMSTPFDFQPGLPTRASKNLCACFCIEVYNHFDLPVGFGSYAIHWGTEEIAIIDDGGVCAGMFGPIPHASRTFSLAEED